MVMTNGLYDYEPKSIVVTFEDMPGLKVRMRSAPVGDLMDLTVLADAAAAGTATGEQARKLFTGFADRLVSWNLAIKGEPVPATLDGVRSLDTDLFMEILEGWFEGMTQAPKASPTPSSNGSLPPGLGSLPMATLPPSPVS